MTVAYEKDKKHAAQYNDLEFVEFLEMIARLAYIKFLGSEIENDLGMSDKINFMLDALLPLIGGSRQDVDVDEEDDDDD